MISNFPRISWPFRDRDAPGEHPGLYWFHLTVSHGFAPPLVYTRMATSERLWEAAFTWGTQTVPTLPHLSWESDGPLVSSQMLQHSFVVTQNPCSLRCKNRYCPSLGSLVEASGHWKKVELFSVGSQGAS